VDEGTFPEYVKAPFLYIGARKGAFTYSEAVGRPS